MVCCGTAQDGGSVQLHHAVTHRHQVSSDAALAASEVKGQSARAGHQRQECVAVEPPVAVVPRSPRPGNPFRRMSLPRLPQLLPCHPILDPGAASRAAQPEVFTRIFMIMVSKGVGTAKGALELGEYGFLRTVSAPRKGHLSGEGYKESTQGGGSRAGLVGHVVGRGRRGRDGGPGRGGAAAAAAAGRRLAGTTVDPVDSLVELDGQLWRFVDTAGLRKRVNTASGAEYYASLRTRCALAAHSLRTRCALAVRSSPPRWRWCSWTRRSRSASRTSG